MKKTISIVLILALGTLTEVVNADFTLGTPTSLGPTVNSSTAEGYKEFKSEYWLDWQEEEVWQGIPVLEVSGPGTCCGGTVNSGKPSRVRSS